MKDEKSDQGRTAGPLVQNWKAKILGLLEQRFDKRMGERELFDEEARHDKWFEAFADWADEMHEDGTLKSQASVEAYMQLWSTLTDWAITQDPAIAVDQLTEADLSEYLKSRAGRSDDAAQVSERHAWRLLTFVDRVLVHRAKMQGRNAANRCAHKLLNSEGKWRWAHTDENTPDLEHLSARNARKLVDFLTASLPRSGRRGALRTWKELRDATAVALLLGGGLTPREVRDLKNDDVTIEKGSHRANYVVVKAHGQTPRREVPLAQWAARVLTQWVATRSDHGFEGEWLLPSTNQGSQWKKSTQNKAVEAVLDLAQLDDDEHRGGCFRLRHTYALRQLARGTSLEELGNLLGLRDEDAIARYRTAQRLKTKVH